MVQVSHIVLHFCIFTQTSLKISTAVLHIYKLTLNIWYIYVLFKPNSLSCFSEVASRTNGQWPHLHISSLLAVMYAVQNPKTTIQSQAPQTIPKFTSTTSYNLVQPWGYRRRNTIHISPICHRRQLTGGSGGLDTLPSCIIIVTWMIRKIYPKDK